jgi:hypothetical protein
MSTLIETPLVLYTRFEMPHSAGLGVSAIAPLNEIKASYKGPKKGQMKEAVVGPSALLARVFWISRTALH